MRAIWGTFSHKPAQINPSALVKRTKTMKFNRIVILYNNIQFYQPEIIYTSQNIKMPRHSEKYYVWFEMKPDEAGGLHRKLCSSCLF